MSRKILITFLGTSNYKECVYTFNNFESAVVKYVQVAMVDIFCKEWKDRDMVFIFLTEQAKKINWTNGLENEIPKDLKYSTPTIPEGFEESDIWKTFDTVFGIIEDNDEIILDITHSYRFLPTLTTVLLHYVKFLKNAKVKGIYYGAFEALGTAYDIEKRIPKPEDRKAPIIDLTSFSILQDWTIAAENFIINGNPKKLSQLTNEQVKPILKNTQGKDETSKKLRDVSQKLVKLNRNITTCRGKIIISKEFADINDSIESLQDTSIIPLNPILDKVKEKVSRFKKGDTFQNGFQAALWCQEHGLIQQGLTILQETVVGYILNSLGENYLERDNRDIVTKACAVVSNSIDYEQWDDKLKSNTDLTNKIINKLNEYQVYKKLNQLQEMRNDINHGGFRDNAKNPEAFEGDLKECISFFIPIYK